ncbi:hypothetical protein [Subtercola boreus]|nr:hypothetical protein [Subtercola boreus]
MESASARRVFAAAREAGVFVMDALWTGFTPTNLALRERIARG